MEWMPKQSNFSFPGLMVFKTRFIRKASSFLCFLVALSPCFFPVAARADTNTLSQAEITVAVYDALTRIFLGQQLTVNGVVFTSPFLYPSPSAPTLGEWLSNNFGYDTSYSSPPDTVRALLNRIADKPSGAWTTNDILRLLSAVNDARSPWATNDIVRLLSAVNAARSPWSSNDVTSVRSDVSDLLDFFHGLSVWTVAGGYPALSVKDGDLINLFDYVYRAYDSYGNESVRVHDEDSYQLLSSIQDVVGNEIPNYLRAVIEAIEQSGADISGNLHEIGDLTNVVGGVNANIDELATLLEERFLPSVTNSEEYARLIHEVDLGYYSDGGRSVRSDFRFLHQQLGFENPSASNSLAGVLARFFDYGEANSVIASNEWAVAAIDSAESSLTNAVVQSEVASSNVATNSPDFEEHQYTASNPIDTGDNIFDLPERQFASITPELPASSDSTIVLYNGNFPIFRPSSQNRSSSLSSSPVRLNISYALRDNDDVSGGINVLRSIMQFVWDWVFLVLSVSMLFSFYKSLVAPSNVGSGFGIGGSAME